MVGLGFCDECHYRMFDEDKVYWTTKGLLCEDCFAEYKKDYKSPEDEIERLKKGILTAIETTHDDDTWDFLNRLLEGKENDAPDYRIKVND